MFSSKFTLANDINIHFDILFYQAYKPQVGVYNEVNLIYKRSQKLDLF